MKILIVGASGFVGGHLIRFLQPLHRLVCVARAKSIEGENIEWISTDITSPQILTHLPTDINAIVYLAQARGYRQFPEKADEIFQVNVQAFMRFLEFSRLHGVGKLIYASSANIYKRSRLPINETSVIDPLSFYARSKYMAELLLQSYQDFFHCVTLRLFTVYGPGQTGTLIPSLLTKICQNEKVQIEGEEGLKLSPVYVDDVCEVMGNAIEKNARNKRYEVFNVGGDEALSIIAMANALGTAVGECPQFQCLGGLEPGGWVADNSRLKSALGPIRFTPFSAGLCKTLHEKPR